MNTGLIILAAGASERLGTPKALLPVEGKSLLKHLAEELLDLPFYPISVVVGAHKDRLLPELEGMPLNIIDNPQWAMGAGTSFKMGLVGTYLIQKSVDALIFTGIAQPMLSRDDFDLLHSAAVQSEKPLVAAKSGMPILVKRPFFDKILDLGTDESVDALLTSQVGEIEYVEMPEANWKIDTPADLRTFLENPPSGTPTY